MVSDKSKKMDVVYYDWRDMPVRFELKETGELWNSSVNIVYDAAGNRVLKKEKVEIDGSVTRAKAVAYAGSNMVFENDNYIAEPYSLKYFNIDQEGRMDFPSLTNYYYIKDHLGSTRMVVDESGEAIEANMYDAYGKLEQLVYSGVSSRLREKFTGKELDDDSAVAGETNGLELYYFGKRYYDPEVGTFTTTDPEKQYWNSYSYCDGDPINLVDPDGATVAFVAPAGWLLKKVAAEKFLEFTIPMIVKSYAAPTLIGAITGLYVYKTFLRSTLAPWTVEPQSETPWVQDYVNQQISNIMQSENAQVQEGAQGGKQEGKQEGAQEGEKIKPGELTANPDDYIPAEGETEVTKTKEATGGRHRQWKNKKGETTKRWDKGGREGGKERGPHWHDVNNPKGPDYHIEL